MPIVVLTGSGISAGSGLHTFRGSGGTWKGVSVEEVATPKAWAKDRARVLEFYNQRRRAVLEAKPNPAHLALATLAKHAKVHIITQNIDDLHERAGSTGVLHLHGDIVHARSTHNPRTILPWTEDIKIGDKCPKGSQLRPDVVWFGEQVRDYFLAEKWVKQATLLMIVGTSLTVHPAADLIAACNPQAPIMLVDPQARILADLLPEGRTLSVVPDLAEAALPTLVAGMIRETEVTPGMRAQLSQKTPSVIPVRPRGPSTSGPAR